MSEHVNHFIGRWLGRTLLSIALTLSASAAFAVSASDTVNLSEDYGTHPYSPNAVCGGIATSYGTVVHVSGPGATTVPPVGGGIITLSSVSNLNGTDVFTVVVLAGATCNLTLTVNVAPVNDPPTMSTNTGLTLDEGTSATITSSELAASDVDNTTSQLTFTVTTAPVNGTIKVSGTAASTFTQADIDGDALTYLHDGSASTSDAWVPTIEYS